MARLRLGRLPPAWSQAVASRRINREELVRKAPIVSTFLLALLVATPALAQEMTFEPEPLDEPGPAGATSAPTTGAALPRAVVLVIRSGEAEASLARAITDALSRQVLASGKVEVMPSEDFEARLLAPGERAAQDCVTNAVCLSGYGKELWLDRIVVGVLYKGAGGYNLNVDLVGVENAEVEQYANRDLPRLASLSREELEQEMGGVVFKLFGLVDPTLDPEGPRKRLVAQAGPVQTGLAWGAAGVAGVALVAGLVLGAQARSIASELDSDGGLTMREARDKIDEGEGKALGAYLSFAASGVLLATSAALFLIRPMQEVDLPVGPATPCFSSNDGPRLFWDLGAGPATAGLTLGLRY